MWSPSASPAFKGHMDPGALWIDCQSVGGQRVSLLTSCLVALMLPRVAAHALGLEVSHSRVHILLFSEPEHIKRTLGRMER